MTVVKYRIVADEGWTHQTPPLNRYWCFLGGTFGPEGEIDRLERSLQAVCSERGQQREVKYGKISSENIDTCVALLNVYFETLAERDLRYRQLFLDRALIHVPTPGADELTPLDVQFRIYYQFVKHAFGLRYLPRIAGVQYEIVLQLDDHTSRHHTARLRDFVEDVHGQFDRDDMTLIVSYVKSTRMRVLQLCDLLIGAAGFYGNKHHLRRPGGRRGMSAKQKLRLHLAEEVYGRLRRQNQLERGKKSFNWFESTGRDGEIENVLNHKVRIWKIVPRRHQVDSGWQNDHLTNEGLYQGAVIDPRIRQDMGDAS